MGTEQKAIDYSKAKQIRFVQQAHVRSW